MVGAMALLCTLLVAIPSVSALPAPTRCDVVATVTEVTYSGADVGPNWVFKLDLTATGGGKTVKQETSLHFEFDENASQTVDPFPQTKNPGLSVDVSAPTAASVGVELRFVAVHERDSRWRLSKKAAATVGTVASPFLVPCNGRATPCPSPPTASVARYTGTASIDWVCEVTATPQ